MKRQNKIIFILILLLGIGFATVTTTLYLNGNTTVTKNENAFIEGVIFDEESIEVSSNASYVLSDSARTITWTTPTFNEIGAEDTIYFKIRNDSQYDATLGTPAIVCKFVSSYKDDELSENGVTTNPYLSLTPATNLNGVTINAGGNLSEESHVTAKQIKSYKGNEDSNEQTIKFQCSIEATASESTESNQFTPSEGGSEPQTLNDLIYSKADLTTIIDFSKSGAGIETNGVYVTTETESENPVYYYRGNVDNNLIFNNMCWKIIRTTETGGTKIIYNGEVIDNKCEMTGSTSNSIGLSEFNELSGDSAYVGYMYGIPNSATYELTHQNTNNSTIKTKIDTWFEENFDETIINKLEDTVFCNDRNPIRGSKGIGAKKNYFGVYDRSSTNSDTAAPTLKCINTVYPNNDKFTLKETKPNYNESLNGNKTLDYPVGLISADEAEFGGLNYYKAGIDNYLYSSQQYWTSTTNYTGVTGADYHLSLASSIGQNTGTNSFGIHPVVSLVNGTKVTGSGTTTNPYIVI